MVRQLPDDVTAVMRSLLRYLDELVEQVSEDVWLSIEDYQDTLTDEAQLERVVHRSLEVVLSATAQLRPIGPDDLAESERLGETRALQGFAATSLMQSYRAAERCLVDCFLHSATGLDGPSCGQGIRSLRYALDQLERAAVRAYRRTEQAVALAHETTVAALLSRLASGMDIDTETVLQQAATADIDPYRSYVGIAVLVPPSTDVDRRPRLQRQLARRIAELERSKVPSVMWQGIMLLLVPRNAADEQLHKLLVDLASDSAGGPHLIVGVGDASTDLIGAGQSFRHAAAAARLGAGQGRLGEVVVYGDVALQVLLAANPDVGRTIVQHRLGELLTHPELLRTVRSYLACDRTVTRTADALGVHPNTVSYRLRQIEDVTGINTRHVSDLTDIDLALRALELLPRPHRFTDQPFEEA